MKLLRFRIISALTLGLGLTLILLGLMTYLNAEAVLAAGPYHVAPNCAGVPAPCYTSVQTAVDAAAPGEVILVAAGTYTGVNVRLSGAFNSVLVTQTLYLSKNVTIRGGYTTSFIEPPDPQANPAILDAQGQGRVIYSVDASPTIEGLQLTHGNARVAGDPLGNPVFHGGGLFALTGVPVVSGNVVISNVADYGGGVDVFSGGGILRHNLIAANTALNGGGGVHVSSGTITLDSNQVMSNTAPEGGGALGDGGGIMLNGGLFQNNTSTDNTLYGGGIAVQGTLILTGTQFISNTTRAGGGGAFASNRAILNGGLFQNNSCTGSYCDGGGLLVAGPTNLTGTQFLSNTSASNGGGALLAGSVTLYGGLFRNNHSLSSAGGGGGLWMNGALSMTSTKFLDNKAEFDGGGLYHIGSAGNTTRIMNAIFAGNSADHRGTALFLGSSGSVEILHTTIASPTMDSGAGIVINNGTVGITNTLIASYTTGISQSNGTVYEDYNLFFGTAVSKIGVFAPGSGANDGTGNPAFVNPLQDDYHLGPASAAIDRGINAGVATDIDGDTRPQGAAPDLGADEFAAPVLSIGKSGPISGTAGSPITYTLTVTNSGGLTATNLVITDTVPPGATYVGGGTQANGVVSWTLPALSPRLSATVQFVVTATDSLVNRTYGVTVDGGYGAMDGWPVGTFLSQDCKTYPLAIPKSALGQNYPVVVDLYLGDSFGGFGWVSWNPTQNSEMYLLSELQNPALSLTDFTNAINPSDHSLSRGDSIRKLAGVIHSNDYFTELEGIIGSVMRVPAWYVSLGNGSNAYYRVVDFILVQITSFAHGPYADADHITLTYLGPAEDPETCRSLGVELTPAQPQSGPPGQVLTYTHRLTNLSHTPETALLTYTTSLTGWPVVVTPYSQTLAPGQAVTVTALVTVPLNSPDGLTQLTKITASLTISPAVSAAVTDTTSVVNKPQLSLSKSGPAAVTPGSPITYTLTVTNSGNLTATNLVITDAIPAGATYVGGGTKVGNVVSWTVSSLAAWGGVTQTSFIVTATQAITNSDYGVRADGGYIARGNTVMVTVMGEVTTEQSVFLPVILKK